jgi:hypothetical protein
MRVCNNVGRTLMNIRSGVNTISIDRVYDCYQVLICNLARRIIQKTTNLRSAPMAFWCDYPR